MIDIIDIVRNNRNAIIKTFLEDDSAIERYLRTKCDDFDQIVADTIKNRLSELLITPVDVRYYAPLIRRLIHTGEIDSVKGQSLYLKEIELLFENTINEHNDLTKRIMA